MQTEKINIQDIHPAAYNPRIMPEKEYQKLKNSLDTFGLVDPIIIDLKHDNTIIGGHQRYQVLMDNNDEQELTLIQLGDIGLIIKEEDIILQDINDQKALNLALNKISGEWDYNKLDDILIELTDDNYNIELTGFDLENIQIDSLDIEDGAYLDEDISDDEKYTQEIKAPIYTPKLENPPSLDECYDTTKMVQLQKLIDKLPEDNPSLVKFLREATHRFVEYNYGNIAEYYCHQPKEIQLIMEELILIIIDSDQAIQKGFLKISNKLSKESSGEDEYD